ncbi:MAG: hypothetical protein U1D31_03425 [Patescibacteria group bacterium]|nr:hypothetical protein [Patescibacteria group bacterium]
MTDCIQPTNDKQFDKVGISTLQEAHTRQSRDYFTAYADDKFIGYEITNCCGHFILAMARLY